MILNLKIGLRKRITANGLILSAGLFLTLTGLALLLSGIYEERKIKNFEGLMDKTAQIPIQGDYSDLPRITDAWQEIANDAGQKQNKKYALYNNGWINLMAFQKDGEHTAYLSARNSLRESLRKDPSYFDAKHNLSVLEELARVKGIQPLKLPPPIGGIPPQTQQEGGENEANQRDDRNTDLKNKLTQSGSIPSLGGNPPDPDTPPGPEENTTSTALGY
ncbi:MAG: hypothetical protein A3B96_03305 [Candidatus Spechtbacteria bacterium RIFCSPHIGHO2_02_FULL_43_15b]|uniref:Uncharacterized protein n=1 Tax=Candidatus Spechtbacteria bacterium RIFCSPHIGHO2_01_FULL_43_30 TaxID=1802158 RepID=A0A1G2H8Y2_9BACT|nr:MAG: hypothetical protein A2827_00340 [Candidatus Spechtbacteria bacterium RIFCSPHIGHO2_01_FULL_43_30]OGZ59769.1 MAG: hypothetical protein A3B96_03305 [Candidatus Spechtbacteria bacterium RIFCSPHIGHO2_02_FULL_43_15b]